MTATELRSRWAAGQPAHGVWSLLPGAVTAELLARTGVDYVVRALRLRRAGMRAQQAALLSQPTMVGGPGGGVSPPRSNGARGLWFGWGVGDGPR